MLIKVKNVAAGSGSKIDTLLNTNYIVRIDINHAINLAFICLLNNRVIECSIDDAMRVEKQINYTR